MDEVSSTIITRLTSLVDSSATFTDTLSRCHRLMTFTLPRQAKLEINKRPSIIPPTCTREIPLDNYQIHSGHWYKIEQILVKLVKLVKLEQLGVN